MEELSLSEEQQPRHVAPKESARPLDQGLSDACTLHAISNAIVEGLNGQTPPIDIKLDEVVGALKQSDKVDIHEGNNVEEFDGQVVKKMIDKNTQKCGDVHIEIARLYKDNRNKLFTDLRRSVKLVLVYYTDPKTKHCVYMKQLVNDLVDGKKMYLCVNSWGSNNEYPLVDRTQKGNVLYGIISTWKEIKEPDLVAACAQSFPTKTTKPFEPVSIIEHPSNETKESNCTVS